MVIMEEGGKHDKVLIFSLNMEGIVNNILMMHGHIVGNNHVIDMQVCRTYS
jgi:hypothetical protein